MTLVVTGASGFLGRHVIDAALRRGRDVIALTRDRRRLEERPNLRVVETDFASVDLPRACTVVHLAALRNAPGAKLRDLMQVNVELAKRIAHAAVAANAKRFIHFATAMVLGSSRTPLDESAPLAELDDPYVASKAAGLRALEAVPGLPLIALLPAIVYGPDHPLARNRITSHMWRLLSRPFRVAIAGASAPRNLVFVDDVVRAVERAEEETAGVRRLVAGEDVIQDDLELAVYKHARRKPAPRIVVPRVFVRMAARAADAIMQREQNWSRRFDTLLAPWSFRPSDVHTPLSEGIARTLGNL